MVYLAKMVNGFIFYNVVRCWCLFPGTALWDWVLNSGLVEKLPSASCQVFSALNDFLCRDVSCVSVAHVCGFARCVQSQ